jgi:outer membrane protein OmpA-like peptidoglycan-associated protein
MTVPFVHTSRTEAPKDDHWIPLGDLMTGLMMMFLLVAIAFMMKVEADSKDLRRLKAIAERQAADMKRAASIYDELREQLYRDLEREFRDDLPRWKARLERDLTIRFEEPDVLFKDGQAALEPAFKVILEDFFPRYVRTVSAAKYRDSIDEMRIEGHTSIKWNSQTPVDVAYFKNMELSQSRTRTTLEYVLMLSAVAELRSWLIGKVTANGLSSSRPRLNPDGTENEKASRRVEFRIRTDAEARISEILRAGQE